MLKYIHPTCIYCIVSDIYVLYFFKVVRTNLYELYIMNHERFINIITIFDQFSILLAEKQICGDWRIKDLLLNIVIILIHGESVRLTVYWSETANCDY